MPAITGTVLAVAGIASAGAGMITGAKAAKQQNEYQQQILADQQKQEALRQKAMELDARRRQMESLRVQQRARALALATATNQGAAQGSGLFGGYGQIQGQGGNNTLAGLQSLYMGRENFAINSDISSARIGLGNAQTDLYTAQALTGFGNSLVSNASTIGKIGQEFFGAGSAASTGSWYKSPSALYANNNSAAIRF